MCSLSHSSCVTMPIENLCSSLIFLKQFKFPSWNRAVALFQVELLCFLKWPDMNLGNNNKNIILLLLFLLQIYSLYTCTEKTEVFRVVSVLAPSPESGQGWLSADEADAAASLKQSCSCLLLPPVSCWVQLDMFKVSPSHSHNPCVCLWFLGIKSLL